MDIEESADLVASALRADITEKDDSYLFELPSPSDEEPSEVSIEKGYIQELQKSISSKSKHEENILYDKEQYEVLLKERSRYGPSVIRRRGEIRKSDDTNGVEYRFGIPSD